MQRRVSEQGFALGKCLNAELPCGKSLQMMHILISVLYLPSCSLSLRYLIRPDPLAHVPEEPPVHSSSLKESHESSIDTREDTQL